MLLRGRQTSSALGRTIRLLRNELALLFVELGDSLFIKDNVVVKIVIRVVHRGIWRVTGQEELNWRHACSGRQQTVSVKESRRDASGETLDTPPR